MPEDKTENIINPSEKPARPAAQVANVHSIKHSERHELYIGSLPHPELLAKYNNAFPNGAERVFKLIEDQVNHRIKIETTNVNGNVSRSKLGLIFGLIVAVLGLLVAAFLGYVGQGTPAAVIGSVDLVALVSVFVLGKVSQSNERVQKAKSMALIAKGIPHAEHREDTQTKYDE